MQSTRRSKREKQRVHKTQPSLPDRARNVVLGLVDIILYGDSIAKKDADGNITIERVVRTKPHPTYEAGDRTGRLPELLLSITSIS